MKHLENTPWYICNENDKNLCAYVDTDSNYFNAEPLLVASLYPNFEDVYLMKIKDDKTGERLLSITKIIISDHYDNLLARDCFNVRDHRLEMKTECSNSFCLFSCY